MSATPKHQEQNSDRYGGEAWVKIVSASVGSAITALTVTPLEVVKVRQQAAGYSPRPPIQSAASAGLPASLCPRGCGTFVLNTGLGEYLTSRDKAKFFDPKTGALKQKKSVAEISKSAGPIRIIRSIFLNEGWGGIYAGLAPSLVMGIPNNVLYFYTYETIAPQLKEYIPPEHSLGAIVPAVAGASARFVASLSTAPLELLRTQQAARAGSGLIEKSTNMGSGGMVSEFRTMIRNDGVLSLFRGVWPTIMRDVPFSAIYWMGIESMRDFWKIRRGNSPGSDTVSSAEQSIEAFINGSVSGVVAAAFTTPLDVLKTRSQIVTTSEGSLAMCEDIACSNSIGRIKAPSTIQLAASILETEGFMGFWRGNTARCMKVCGLLFGNAFLIFDCVATDLVFLCTFS